MAERSGFYNAVLQSDGSYDRVYQAEDFSDCLNLFIPTGIYVTEEESKKETIDKTTVEGLKPYGSGTSLMIKQGKAFIKGQWYVIDEQDLEIPLTINTTKVIVLMHTVVDRETKVQLIDYVNGEIVVPQNDAQFGILLGTVEYTTSELLVTDLREDFMNNSPKHMKAIADKAEKLLTDLDSKVKQMLLLVYPVGSIYMSNKSTNPSSLFGGTWVSWGSGRVPVGVGIGTDINGNTMSFASADKTGGEYTHKLTIDEIPEHTHNYSDGSIFVGEPPESCIIEDGCLNGGDGHLLPQKEYETVTDNSEILQTTKTGKSKYHNNVQPYITCYMWKRTA